MKFVPLTFRLQLLNCCDVSTEKSEGQGTTNGRRRNGFFTGAAKRGTLWQYVPQTERLTQHFAVLKDNLLFTAKSENALLFPFGCHEDDIEVLYIGGDKLTCTAEKFSVPLNLQPYIKEAEIPLEDCGIALSWKHNPKLYSELSEHFFKHQSGNVPQSYNDCTLQGGDDFYEQQIQSLRQRLSLGSWSFGQGDVERKDQILFFCKDLQTRDDWLEAFQLSISATGKLYLKDGETAQKSGKLEDTQKSSIDQHDDSHDDRTDLTTKSELISAAAEKQKEIAVLEMQLRAVKYEAASLRSQLRCNSEMEYQQKGHLNQLREAKHNRSAWNTDVKKIDVLQRLDLNDKSNGTDILRLCDTQEHDRLCAQVADLQKTVDILEGQLVVQLNSSAPNEQCTRAETHQSVELCARLAAVIRHLAESFPTPVRSEILRLLQASLDTTSVPTAAIATPHPTTATTGGGGVAATAAPSTAPTIAVEKRVDASGRRATKGSIMDFTKLQEVLKLDGLHR